MGSFGGGAQNVIFSPDGLKMFMANTNLKMWNLTVPWDITSLIMANYSIAISSIQTLKKMVFVDDGYTIIGVNNYGKTVEVKFDAPYDVTTAHEVAESIYHITNSPAWNYPLPDGGGVVYIDGGANFYESSFRHKASIRGGLLPTESLDSMEITAIGNRNVAHITKDHKHLYIFGLIANVYKVAHFKNNDGSEIRSSYQLIDTSLVTNGSVPEVAVKSTPNEGVWVEFDQNGFNELTESGVSVIDQNNYVKVTKNYSNYISPISGRDLRFKLRLTNLDDGITGIRADINKEE